MSVWDERVTEHRIVEDIRVAKARIEGIVVLPDGEDLMVLDAKARLLAVIDRLQKRLSMVDPYFVPLHVLEEISESLTIIVRCLDDYVARPAPGHLTLANVAADNILGQLSLLWFPRSAEEIEEIRLATVNLRRSLDEHSRALRNQLREISTESSRLAADLDELRRQISHEKSRAARGPAPGEASG